MNKATIIGTVTKTGSKNTQHGPVLDVRIEAKDRYKNASGDIYENVRVIEVSLWGRLAELNANVREGALVEVDAEVRGRVVQTANGGEFVNHSVVAKGFNVLLAPQGAPSRSTVEDFGEPPPQTQSAQEFTDDDIPF